MKKILVIGGAGYIGGLTTDQLVAKGYDVTVFDNLIYETRFLKSCKFIFGDICDTKSLIDIAKNFDEVIWLAAIVGDGACSQSPELTIEINLNAIKRFLSKTKKRVIFTSTCSVYGAQHELLSEKSSVNPLSLYASTKLQAEEYVLANEGLVFRLGTLFGLGDNFSRIRLDLVVNVLTLKAVTQNRLTIFGGEQWRPLLSVSDTASYIVEAVSGKLTGIYNLKYENLTISSIADKIKRIFPKVKIDRTELPYEDLRNYQVDTTKAEKQFKHRPTVTIKEEVLKMQKLFLERRLKDFDDDIYYNTRHIEKMINRTGH
jgi:nucleoside-diphosphate-sugar epimerase|tara:strand:- start:1713 stop:2660 length:948 start_codon:yes stop_codon:yes gene_type:complete